jgi:hypothetical protein
MDNTHFTVILSLLLKLLWREASHRPRGDDVDSAFTFGAGAARIGYAGSRSIGTWFGVKVSRTIVIWHDGYVPTWAKGIN